MEICGAGCVTEEGPEECHDKTITSLIDVPEEVCDLNPQKTCRFQTKLVPKLKPAHECTIIPREVCNLKFTQPQEVEKPLKTKWCLDPTPAEPGEKDQLIIMIWVQSFTLLKAALYQDIKYGGFAFSRCRN